MGLREGPRRPQWRGLAKQGGATAPTRAVPSCSGSRAGANLRGPGLPYVTTLTSHKEPSPGRLEEPLPRENPWWALARGFGSKRGTPSVF